MGNNSTITPLPKCKIMAVSAYGPGFPNWDSLRQHLINPDANAEIVNEGPHIKGPKPTIIPANERRRAPLSVRIAVESSWQAVCMADINPADMVSVFASALGDTSLTDYMCTILASANKALSPTKFHNSVHNAPAGYWTISTQAQGSATSIAGFNETVSLALVEAIIQCDFAQRPVLMTCYDSPVASALQPILPNTQPFACSLIIVPEKTVPEKTEHQNQPDNRSKPLPTLQATISNNLSSNIINNKSNNGAFTNSVTLDWPLLNTPHKTLQMLYQDNPSARILPLLEQLAIVQAGLQDTLRAHQRNPIECPLSQGTTLSLCIDD